MTQQTINIKGMTCGHCEVPIDLHGHRRISLAQRCAADQAWRIHHARVLELGGATELRDGHQDDHQDADADAGNGHGPRVEPRRAGR